VGYLSPNINAMRREENEMTTTMKIALTNLGKYNEGELVYKWVELPATDEALTEAFEEIGINERYEEHFISDYEAPLGIRIGEYESISKLNDIAEKLEGLDVPEANQYGLYDASDVINFAMHLCNEGIVPGADEFVQDIVDDEQLDEMVKHEAESGGWQRVAFFLADVRYTNDEYYYINGYGNAENLTNDRLEGIVSDLVDELRRNL
jgi:hypothetical protein